MSKINETGDFAHLMYVALVNGNEYLIKVNDLDPVIVNNLFQLMQNGTKKRRAETIEISRFPVGTPDSDLESIIAPSGKNVFAEIPVFETVDEFLGHWVKLGTGRK